ncbi:hypothetical protein [Teredinibacter sp. KSP-S5-2]|uniref:hypothetical protein n=1 Tax=Teredinibacter sp. KSP-S5-2 TaxID=3034506 RepID=UPI0029342B22|nr:hypothetical protein [Teredinibacter sp. KSP-S5-2]WNO09989.1 hypothetical protein P5V12_02270 [Teredinibacter sp. KSP-S5-2]
MRLRFNWNIDRLPTKRERIATIVLGLIICALTGAISYFGIALFIKGESGFWQFSFFYVLFLLGLWSLVRAIFGKSTKPSSIAMMAVGLFWLSMGLLILFISLEESDELYMAIMGIASGIAIFKQGYRKRAKP